MRLELHNGTSDPIPYKKFTGFAKDYPRRDLVAGETDVLQSYYWGFRTPANPEAELWFGDVNVIGHNPTIGQPYLSVGAGQDYQTHRFSEGEKCFMYIGGRYYALARNADNDEWGKMFHVDISMVRPTDGRPEC